MNDRVDKMIEDILDKEGGFVNHPADRGGATNFGITIGTLSKQLKRPATIEDVKKLTKESAKAIYRKEYYFSPKIDELPNEIQPLVFDCAVNHGQNAAIKLVQIVLQKLGSPITADGIIGPITIDGCYLANVEMGNYFFNAIIDERNNLYRRIVTNDPSQEVFLRGWLARSESFRKEV